MNTVGASPRFKIRTFHLRLYYLTSISRSPAALCYKCLSRRHTILFISDAIWVRAGAKRFSWEWKRSWLAGPGNTL